VRERLVPNEDADCRRRRHPAEIVAEMRELGLFGLSIPEEYGGIGLGMSEEVQVAFELGQTSPAFRSLLGTNNGIGSQGIVLDGSEEQKRKYLPKLASGEIIGSFALTEPDAGSDAASLRTTAIATATLCRQRHQALHHQCARGRAVHADGAHRSRQQGRGAASRAFSSKPIRRASSSGAAGQEDGPARRPYLRRGLRGLPRAGEPASGGHRRPGLQDGDEGARPRTPAHLRGLRRGRRTAHPRQRCLCDGAQAVRQADRRVPARPGHAGRQPHRGYAARAMVMDAARRRDAGENVSTLASCCKLFASEMVGRVADRAVQVHGGAGYISDYAVERFYRDVRLFRLYEGTSQIQQLVIARDMMREFSAG
jgi:acyl-CoA dehydrogenase